MHQTSIAALKLMAAVVIFPNLCFLTASWSLSLGRPYVNIDYLLASVLILSRFKIFGFILLGIAIAADTLLLTGQVFPFVRIQDISYLLGLLPLAPTTYQIIFLIGTAFIFSLFFLFWKIRIWAGIKEALVLLNVGLLIYSFEVYSTENDRNRFWRISDSPIASSQLVNFFDYRSRAFIQTANLSGEPFSRSGYDGWSKNWIMNPAQLNDRLLLIVNESWGTTVDEKILLELIRPLTNIKKHLDYIESGELNFVGATVAAELRELCQLTPNHYNLSEVTEGFEKCLPNLLREKEYNTRAMHGAVGLMYDRARWYPRAGFEKVTFFESKKWPSRCYSFPGACDIDMLEEIEREFSMPGKRFFYWLTLNSHSFYDSRDIRYDVFDCEHFGITTASESCRNLKLQAQFFNELAKVIQSKHMNDVEIAIIGDHAPPIFDAKEKLKNFKENSVSWVHLKTK